MLFYLLTTFIILVRMFWFCLILFVTTDTADYYDAYMKKFLELTDAVASYGELLLGI